MRSPFRGGNFGGSKDGGGHYHPDILEGRVLLSRRWFPKWPPGSTLSKDLNHAKTPDPQDSTTPGNKGTALLAGRLDASHPRGRRCPQHRCSVRGPDIPDVGSACGPYYICAIVPNFHAQEMMVLVKYILPRRQGVLALTEVQLFPQKVTLNYYRRLLRRAASYVFLCRPVWLFL